MSDRSKEKKQYIIKRSREVFAEKGFKDVTMKDIVEACEISRGGLYLYYDNTEQLFIDVLEYDALEEDMIADISTDMSSAELLAVFLKEQKKLILKKKNQLTVAIYEFYFGRHAEKKDNLLKKQFEDGVRIVETLIAGGVKEGDFVCADPFAKARNIMYVLEGLRVARQTFGITSEMVDQEILSIMQEIVVE